MCRITTGTQYYGQYASYFYGRPPTAEGAPFFVQFFIRRRCGVPTRSTISTSSRFHRSNLCVMIARIGRPSTHGKSRPLPADEPSDHPTRPPIQVHPSFGNSGGQMHSKLSLRSDPCRMRQPVFPSRPSSSSYSFMEVRHPEEVLT